MNKKLKIKLIHLSIIIILLFLFWFINLIYNIRYAKIVYPVLIDINGLNIYDLESIKVFREAPKSGLSEINLIFNKKIKKLNWEVRNYYIKKIFIIIPHAILNKIYSLKINIGENKFIYNNTDILNFKKYNNKKFEKYSDENEIFEIPDITRSKGLNFYFFSDIINIKQIYEILIFSFFESLFLSLIVIFIFYLGFEKYFNF